MVNINKIKELCKNQGIKQGFLCEQLGLQKVYLNDVARGKSSMTDERLHKIADILGTTYEYLTDQTEDPKPPAPAIIADARTEDEALVLKLMTHLPDMTEEEKHTLSDLLNADKQEFSRILEFVRLFMRK